MVNQKSGTNQWHGTLFEFFRNEALNARKCLQPPDPGAIPPQSYGFVLGGRKEESDIFLRRLAGHAASNGAVRTSTVPRRFNVQAFSVKPIFDPVTTRRTDAVSAGCVSDIRFRRTASIRPRGLPSSAIRCECFYRRREATANKLPSCRQRDNGAGPVRWAARHNFYWGIASLCDMHTCATIRIRFRRLPDGSGNLTAVSSAIRLREPTAWPGNITGPCPATR